MGERNWVAEEEMKGTMMRREDEMGGFGNEGGTWGMSTYGNGSLGVKGAAKR